MIDWNQVYKLSPNEFSENPDKYAEEELIYSLGKLRKIIGAPMRPSPVKGALARFGGSNTSQHFVGTSKNIVRKSTASDQFIEGIPFEIFSVIMNTNLFNGIGVYLDTKGPDGKPWLMFHLDIRERNFPFIWIVEKIHNPKTQTFEDFYRYPQYDSKYWRLFNDARFFKNKQFGIG